LDPEILLNLLFLPYENKPSHASGPLRRKKPLTYAICCCEGGGGGGGGGTVRLLLYSTRIIIELICFLFFTELNSSRSYRTQSFSFFYYASIFVFLLFIVFSIPDLLVGIETKKTLKVTQKACNNFDMKK
jgi:hypothetical protein